MINRQHRFHGRGSLRFVYQKGTSVRGSYSSLRYIRNTRQDNYRVAVVVSRKVHKSAVVRNRIRRRIYEAFRELSDRITAPYDLVFTAYADQLATMESPQLRESVATQLEKAGVLGTARHSASSDGNTQYEPTKPGSEPSADA